MTGDGLNSITFENTSQIEASGPDATLNGPQATTTWTISGAN